MALRNGIFAWCCSITFKMSTTTNRYGIRPKKFCLFELSVQGFPKLMKQGTGESKNLEGTQRGALDCAISKRLHFAKTMRPETHVDPFLERRLFVGQTSLTA